MIEIWKEIEGLPNRYEISNLGRCRSFDRVVKWSHSKERLIKGKFLECKAKVNYPTYSFNIGKSRAITMPIHILIAKYFIPNPNNYKYVNHIDKNIFNYSIDNLEWCTQSENVKHGKSKKIYRIRKLS